MGLRLRSIRDADGQDGVQRRERDRHAGQIIKAEPNWSLIPANTPKPIQTLLRRGLRKEVKQRLQAIGDARITIEEVLTTKGEHEDENAPSQPGKRTRTMAAWVGGFVLGAALSAGVVWWQMRSASAPAAMHFSAVTSFAGV